MNQKDFEELMIATGKRPTRIEQILRELLTGEFRDIKQRKVRLHLKKIQTAHKAIGLIISDYSTLEIFIDSDYLNDIKFFEGKNEETVKKLIRHELLHVLTGKKDNDPDFWQACLERKIPVSV